jgi:GNAT superfamily N-acetyltransferase
MKRVEVCVCIAMKGFEQMQIVPLHPKWQLSIRSLLRTEFVDSKCTRNVAWDLGCMLLQEGSPRLMGVCLVDRDGYLRYLMVKEALRGQGWGSRLLQHSLSSISTLTCIPERVAFYERNGFVALGPDLHLHGMIRLTKRETNEGSSVRANGQQSQQETDF